MIEVLLVSILVLWVTIYFALNRLRKVIVFKSYINSLIYRLAIKNIINGITDQNEWDDWRYYDKDKSLSSLFFSIKPLRLRSYYRPHEVRTLLRGEQEDMSRFKEIDKLAERESAEYLKSLETDIISVN